MDPRLVLTDPRLAQNLEKLIVTVNWLRALVAHRTQFGGRPRSRRIRLRRGTLLLGAHGE